MAIQLIIFIRSGKRTMLDIQREFGVVEKTARRWLKSLEDAGVPITYSYIDDSDYDYGGESQGRGVVRRVVSIDRKWRIV